MDQRKIIFLGTGAPDATKYFHSSYLIQENETRILVDTGGGAQILRQLEQVNMPLKYINRIFITHKHTDHILGIFWIMRMVASKISKDEIPPLNIYCSAEVAGIIKTISRLLLKAKVTDLFDDKILFHIISDGHKTPFGDWQLVFFDTHSKKIEEYGVKITFGDGKSFITLGDEPYNENLLNICQNCDYILHEAFCLEKDREIFKPEKINHSTVKEAASFAENLKAKNLILYHTEDKTCNRKELYANEAKKFFSGKVYVPDDLEAVEII